MTNPFQIIDQRLTNIELLLLSIKQPETQIIPTIEGDETFSIPELAKYLKVSISTANRYKKRGIFKYYQTGRTVYFKKSEVDAALAVGNSKGISNG